MTKQRDILEEMEAIAEDGSAFMQYRLGRMYAIGDRVPKDLEKAKYWLTRAVERGDADIQYMLGAMYAEGDGLPRDEGKAEYWFARAAEKRAIE